MNKLIEKVEKLSRKRDIPEIKPGDTVRVYYKFKEGDKIRVQPFEGVVIAIKGAGINRNITVRKISFGIGVERIFPLHSPNIEKIDILKRAKVRRAKLYYLRKIVGQKGTRLKEKK